MPPALAAPMPTDLPDVSRPVSAGPVPEWATVHDYDRSAPAKPGEPVTHLLHSRQKHVERRQLCCQDNVRLESMEAVQRLSQWRVVFQPQTDAVVVHWIRIRRGDQVFDYSAPERFRILQREEGLESFIVDGNHTLLVLLEDVRVGDILETCFTLTIEPRFLQSAASAMFSLGDGASVKQYHFSVHCSASRPLQWRSSSPDLKPTSSSSGETTVWTWAGTDFVAQRREPNTPEWYRDGCWIQFSDLLDWHSVAAAVHQAWPYEESSPAVDELLKQVIGAETNLLAQVGKVIRFVQDDYRYLSVNWDVGGRIPASPSRVAGRRFGDCKELAFLLVHLLKRLGVPARPVLVNTCLRGTIGDMLPTLDAFNHAVVEFTVNGERRWVDAVTKQQGGDALNTVMFHYGRGLAVDDVNGGIIEQPRLSVEQANLYEVKETLLLDTTGNPSVLSLIVIAHGFHAESLRHRFASVPREDIERERLQSCANRYGYAKRIKPMRTDDDRANNRFVIAEVFEVNGFLQPRPEPGMCFFPFPIHLAFNILLLPDREPRRSPFALCYPCDIKHTIEAESSALLPGHYKRCELEDSFVRFSRTHRHLYRSWSVTFAFTTRADAIPPDRVQEHRTKLLEIERESALGVTLPIGTAHPRMRDDFGELPPRPAPVAPSQAAAPTVMYVNAQPAAPMPRPTAMPTDSGSSRTPRRRRRRNGSLSAPKIATIVIVGGLALFCAALLTLLFMVRR